MSEVIETPKSTRGGRRPGAGRPRTGRRRGGPHRARPELSPETPTHITIRVRKHFPELRRREYYAVIRAVLAKYVGRDDFRIVQVSIQETHIHFLIEATSKRALTLGMQSLTITLSVRLTGGLGKVFEQRYHLVPIGSARQARNALAYVLNNWRRHRIDVFGRWPVDPYSSGVTFTGWSRPVSFTLPPEYQPLPVSPTQTPLLDRDWKQYGLIDPYEVPGPLW